MNSPLGKLIQKRKSVRQFLPTKLPDINLLADIVKCAQNAPSGGNLQPWRVHLVYGDKRDAIVRDVAALLDQGTMTQGPEYDVYPPAITNPFKQRRQNNGQQLYDVLGVKKSDTQGKVAQLRKNWSFFDAPAALFFTMDKQLGPPQWSDVGMFMQNVLLLCEEAGLSTCAQESWAHFHAVVRSHLQVPQNEIIFCAVAIGYEDTKAKINTFRSDRTPVEEILTIHSKL